MPKHRGVNLPFKQRICPKQSHQVTHLTMKRVTKEQKGTLWNKKVKGVERVEQVMLRMAGRNFLSLWTS